MMKSLVTGATGFIGSHLVERLVMQGEAVRVLVRSTRGREDLKWLSKVEVVEGDMTNPRSLDTAVQGVERVFHCAAVVTDWDPQKRSYDVNVNGTASLAEAARQAGVRKFVHISTTDVYGYPDHCTTEDAPYHYRGWAYCDTKIDGEKRVWEAYQRGLPVTVLRPASIYGPRSVTVVKEFADLLRVGQMVLVDGGHKIAGLCYVDDLVDCILLAGQEEVGVGRAYNVCDGTQATWKDFVNGLASLLGYPPASLSIPHGVAYPLGWLMEQWGGLFKSSQRPLLTRYAVEFIGTHQDFPIDRARAELGYTPRVFLDEGLRRTEKWIKNGKS